jgi:hypothetical protein
VSKVENDDKLGDLPPPALREIRVAYATQKERIEQELFKLDELITEVGALLGDLEKEDKEVDLDLQQELNSTIE